MAEQLSDTEKIQRELLWGLYGDVRHHARHAELLRSSVVNFMIVISSVLIASIAQDGRLQRNDLIASSGIVFVGLMGMMFAASYTELHERNRLRAMRLRSFLDEKYFPSNHPGMISLLAESDEDHRKSALYRRTRRLTGSTHRFWLLLPGVVLLTGLGLSAAAAFP